VRDRLDGAAHRRYRRSVFRTVASLGRRVGELRLTRAERRAVREERRVLAAFNAERDFRDEAALHAAALEAERRRHSPLGGGGGR